MNEHNADYALADVQAELHAKGYRWHSFSRSSVGGDGVLRYWFNGSMYGEGAGRLARQPGGWFTLDEMRSEKFADGCRAHTDGTIA